MVPSGNREARSAGTRPRHFKEALANLSETAVGAEDLVRGLALTPLDAEIEMAPKVH